MRTLNPTTAIMLFLMGVVILLMGMKKLIKYFAFMKKPYCTVEGEMVGCDREVHHYKLYTSTLCHIKLKFEYEGKTYTVMDENAVSESVFDKLYGDELGCRIRITDGNPYSAALDCRECLAVPRNEGLRYIVIALIVMVIAVL